MKYLPHLEICDEDQILIDEAVQAFIFVLWEITEGETMLCLQSNISMVCEIVFPYLLWTFSLKNAEACVW